MILQLAWFSLISSMDEAFIRNLRGVLVFAESGTFLRIVPVFEFDFRMDNFQSCCFWQSFFQVWYAGVIELPNFFSLARFLCEWIKHL